MFRALFRRGISRIRAFFKSGDLDRELDQELRAHMELLEQEHVRRGLAPEQARRAARVELGGITSLREQHRGVRGLPVLESVLRDLHYAFRVLARQRSFFLVAVLSLGLGVAATTAIFSLVNALWLHSLPVRDPDRMVTLGADSRSYFAYGRLRSSSGEVLEDILATTGPEPRDLAPGDLPVRGYVELVSGNYFELLGLRASLGRFISPSDDNRAQPQSAAVISSSYWQKAFARDPMVVGRTLRIQKVKFTVIGVAPPGFSGTSVGESTDVWAPLSTLSQVFVGRQWLDRPNTNFLALLGRLRPGVTPARASAILTPVSQQIDLDRAGPNMPPEFRKAVERETLIPTSAFNGTSRLRSLYAKPLRIVFAMVAVVFFLICLNIMNLQLARTDERRREFSLRLAIGASRAQLARQIFVEILVVVCASAVLGFILYQPIARALTSLISVRGEPARFNLGPDSNLVLFVLALGVFAACVCGVVPLWKVLQGDLGAVSQAAPRFAEKPLRRVFGRMVTASQYAFSMILVGASLLFAVSLYQLTHSPTGVDNSNLFVLDVDARESALPIEAMPRAIKNILERLRSIPGVTAATASENGLFSGRNSNTQVIADGFEGDGPQSRNAFYDQVGPGYFATLGARLTQGRDFAASDEGTPVAIINETFRQHYFGNQNPIGKNIYVLKAGNQRTPFQVVGLAADIRTDMRQPARRQFYLPGFTAEGSLFTTRFILRAAPHLAGLADRLRASIHAENPDLSVVAFNSSEDLLGQTMGTDRLIALLSSGFGVLALILATIGIYGMLTYQVARRRTEIGVRMALGAGRPSVMKLVLAEFARAAIPGIAAGVAGASLAGRLVTSFVFGIQPLDLRILVSAAALLLAAGALAASLPARNAASIDPTVALRGE